MMSLANCNFAPQGRPNFEAELGRCNEAGIIWHRVLLIGYRLARGRRLKTSIDYCKGDRVFVAAS
jgi:hypothetical protein